MASWLIRVVSSSGNSNGNRRANCSGLKRDLVSCLRRSLTWDRGKEISAHAQFFIASGVKVYFADPKSRWQRRIIESTNGPLRQYFPKGTDLSRWPAEDIAIAHTLNTRS